jgi:hypothetical protein
MKISEIAKILGTWINMFREVLGEGISMGKIFLISDLLSVNKFYLTIIQAFLNIFLYLY